MVSSSVSTFLILSYPSNSFLFSAAHNWSLAAGAFLSLQHFGSYEFRITLLWTRWERSHHLTLLPVFIRWWVLWGGCFSPSFPSTLHILTAMWHRYSWVPMKTLWLQSLPAEDRARAAGMLQPPARPMGCCAGTVWALSCCETWNPACQTQEVRISQDYSISSPVSCWARSFVKQISLPEPENPAPPQTNSSSPTALQTCNRLQLPGGKDQACSSLQHKNMGEPVQRGKEDTTIPSPAPCLSCRE